MNSSNAFGIHIFLFRSYSFGIETISTFIHVHSRSLLENRTRFQTKMGKVFSDQKGPKILPFRAAHTYMAYIRGYLPGSWPLSWLNKMGVENSILLGSWLREPGGTPPPRISRCIYNLNSRVLLFRDLLILFYFSLPRTNWHLFYHRSP